MGHRLWLPAVAIHRLSVVEIARHLLVTVFARPVRSPLMARQQSQSSPDPAGKDSPILTEAGTSVCQAVFPEPQSAAVCRRVERRDCAHEALPRLQSASSWLVMEHLIGVWRLSFVECVPCGRQQQARVARILKGEGFIFGVS